MRMGRTTNKKSHSSRGSSSGHKSLFTFMPKREDSLIWNYTSDGKDIVKYGYWLANKLSNSEDTPKPPLVVHPDIATEIWKLRITPKLRHFLLRTISRAIGTAEHLLYRKIRVNQMCSRCCVEKETSDHVFLM